MWRVSMMNSSYFVLFKVHVSFAITFAVEGFFPIDSSGYTATSFKDLNQALPLITLIISLITSSLGMTKFFLLGPIPILPKDSPINGLVSLPFVCLWIINTMFGVRVICIENAFFSSYRYQHYPAKFTYEHSFIEKKIEPIIPPEYRLLVYFTPSFISFIINVIRLATTGTKVKQYIKRRYPQILIASCFTPFMFENFKENGKAYIKIWKLGTILNAFYIGFLPQVVLFAMDLYRGVNNWNFIGQARDHEQIYENNDSLFKYHYGNLFFAVITGMFYGMLIIFTFFTDKIFKSNGIYCKCGSILCLPCPQNCFDLTKTLSPSPAMKVEQTIHNVNNESTLGKQTSTEDSEVIQNISTKIYMYTRDNITWLMGESSPDDEIALPEVQMKTAFLIVRT